MLTTASGCKQQVFITQADSQESKQLSVDMLENKPNATDKPVTDIWATPATTHFPERKERFISLAESISIALEQGSTGIQQNPFIGSGGQPGAASGILAPVQDQLGALNPPSNAHFNGSEDAIRVLRLDPAIVGAGIESSLSKFDAVWSSSATWNTTDTPVGTSLQTFQSAGQTSVDQVQNATVSTGLIKPLSTGGVTSITFDTVYTRTNLPALVNPSYQPTLQFGFEQPLLQGFGTEINELRPNSPGSLLHPGTFNTQPTAEGILVTRLRYDQQRTDFELKVNFMLLNVEVAYWNLYNAYWNLYSQETGLRLAYEAWRIFNARYAAGKVSVADLAQTRGQYELFRSQRLGALNSVLESERELRLLLGLPGEDGDRLVPADQPTLAAYTPDWATAVESALALKPELVLARQEVKAAQMNLLVARDAERPDIRFTATYDFNDIGSRLDGPGTENAFRNLSDGRFSNWSVGIQGNIPIGFRDAHAKSRVAKLQLARTYEVLKDQEMKTQRFMVNLYRLLDYNYEQIKINRAQREAYGQQIRALSEQIKVGSQTPDILLEAQRFYATALSSEYQFIAGYNEILVAWEFMKGTIMQHDNVVISEGGLPGTVQVRAVEHERERSKALEIREHNNPIQSAPMDVDGKVGVIPQIPSNSAASLPALLSNVQPLPPAPEVPGGLPPIMPKVDSSRMTLPSMLPGAAVPATTPLPNAGSVSGLPPGPLLPPAAGRACKDDVLFVSQPRGSENDSEPRGFLCSSVMSCSSSFTNSRARAAGVGRRSHRRCNAKAGRCSTPCCTISAAVPASAP